jgi:hypothetical protein
MSITYLEETTDWGSYKIQNHIYITDGELLVGYVPKGGKEIRFSKPKQQWAVDRRTFRPLTKAEIERVKKHGNIS